MTIRSRPATSNANSPDPGALQPEEAKDESATEDKALEPRLLEEARGESPTDTIRTPQPLGPKPPEEARGESATVDIRTPQPEPPEEAKDDPIEDNTVPSQPLCTRLLVPNEAPAMEDISTANSQPLKPGPLVSGKAEAPEDASTVSTPQPWAPEPNSGRDATVIAPTPILLQSLPVPLNVERLAPEEAKTRTRYKLKLEIDDCKKYYHGTKFIVNCDAFSLCVESDEIEKFFHRFEETVWFSDRQLMPMILSFNWPSTTLVLANSYAPKSQLKINSASNKTRWPLNRRHDRVILPYCSEKHWTLFDVDLRHHVI